MREEIRDKERLQHILTSIDYIEEFIKNISFEEFCKDKLRYFAIVKNIEIIGEASYRLSSAFKNNHPQTPWKMIEGTRHYIVHDYYQVDSRIVWEVASQDLPNLKTQIEEYLKQYK